MGRPELTLTPEPPERGSRWSVDQMIKPRYSCTLGGPLNALHLACFRRGSLSGMWRHHRWKRDWRNHRNGWLCHVRRQGFPQGRAALRQIWQARKDHAVAASDVHLGRHNDFRVYLADG